MANFCLPKFAADSFKARLKDGTIDPNKLRTMTSAERRAFFNDIVGETNALRVNAEFESKLLLKDQQAGMITWAKNAAGMKEPARRDMIAKIQRLDKVLDPDEADAFLADLVEQRLGLGVTAKEASDIATLSRTLQEKKAASSALSVEDYLSGKKRDASAQEYGDAYVALADYTNELVRKSNGLSIADFTKGGFNNRAKAVGRGIEALGGQAKSITASLDNSSIFNQGWKTLWTNPIIWAKNASQTFVTLAKTVGGKDVMRQMNADIVSRPTYDLMKKAKLAVGTTEEAFPTALPEKIPYAGRIYKASQDAYTGFVHRTRADVFDRTLQLAQKSGVDITDKAQLEAIGAMVNSLTGRGSFGRLEGSAVDAANNLLFAPRFLKSNFDVFLHPVTGAGGSNFVRKQAAINLLKIVAGTAGVLKIAEATLPGSVEWDPRSADFGKIKVGNTRFAVGGGAPAIVTLASRLITGTTKSSTSGNITALRGEDRPFGRDDSFDVLLNFFSNKAAPLPALVRDVLKGEDFNGNPVTPGRAFYNLYAPFPVKTYEELAKDPDSAPDIAAMILSGLGINVMNYGESPKN